MAREGVVLGAAEVREVRCDQGQRTTTSQPEVHTSFAHNVQIGIYTAMNLGAFAVIIAVARRTASAELDSYRGLFHYAPGLAVAMTVFLMALAGIPPLGGWFAKFDIMRAVISANTPSGVVLGLVVAVNSVIALYYYARVTITMWVEPAPEDADTSPIRIPLSLRSALVITGGATLVFGIVPQAVGHFTDVSLVLSSAGG